MSLVCHECGFDIKPSSNLPGREGIIIHPVVISVAWLSDEIREEKWALVYVEAPHNLVLCLECISGRLPETQRPFIGAVYDAYVAEEKYCLSHGRLDTFEVFEEKYVAIPFNQCVFCNGNVQVSRKPYFTAKVINKAYSQAHTSLFGSYLWSDIREGMTHFEICFGCFKDNFPRSFEQLGYYLNNLNKLNLAEVVKSSIFLSPDIIELLKEEVGEERAREIIQGLFRTVQD